MSRSSKAGSFSCWGSSRDIGGSSPTCPTRSTACRRGRCAGEVGWRSTFHVSHHLAAREAIGRVALAGDAAHLHSPVATRGMNPRDRRRLCVRGMRCGRPAGAMGSDRGIRPSAPRGAPQGDRPRPSADRTCARTTRSGRRAAPLPDSRHGEVSADGAPYARASDGSRPRGAAQLTGPRAGNQRPALAPRWQGRKPRAPEAAKSASRRRRAGRDVRHSAAPITGRRRPVRHRESATAFGRPQRIRYTSLICLL